MIRKFNYTGRKRVRRTKVAIALVGGPTDYPRRFNAALNLEGLELPPTAQVYIEAYRASSYKRFPFGTVGNILPPLDRSLEDLDGNVDLRFRVKVVDEAHAAGRLLAVADNLAPVVPEEEAQRREPLVPLQIVDLGERVWRLSFEDFPDGPVVLQVNSRIADIEHVAKHDREFRALVFPSVLEQVLTFIIRVEEFDPNDAQREVQKWLRFVNGFFANALPEDESQHEPWIMDAVSAFCVQLRTREQFEQSRAQE